MSQRNVTKLEKPAVRRTLRRFWEVTRMKPGATALAVFTSVAYIALLVFVNTWVMGLIVDRVQAAPSRQTTYGRSLAPTSWRFWP